MGTKVVEEVVEVVEDGIVLVEPVELDDTEVMELEELEEVELADVEDELELEEEVVELADVDVDVELEDEGVEVVELVGVIEPLELVDVLVTVPLFDVEMLVDVEVGAMVLEELLELEAVRLYIWRRLLAPQYSY